MISKNSSVTKRRTEILNSFKLNITPLTWYVRWNSDKRQHIDRQTLIPPPQISGGFAYVGRKRGSSLMIWYLMWKLHWRRLSL